ncbi:MAG TPA: methyltransferase domain-containing protein [Thermoplasmata archaeon]|nr:methyltransferase domain-containing protein [Thermoplasmata archaeon]
MAVDYSRHAAGYDRVRGDEAMDREFWLRGLVEVGRLRDGERVLDLGAGTGRFAQLLSTTNRVVALDSSDAMLRIARAKGSFACVEGDGHRLPFRADTFDLATVVMVLHHLGNYGAALRDVARVAHRVVIATSDMATRRLGILEEAFPSLLAIDRKRFPPIPAIVHALEEAGFRAPVVDNREYVRRLTTEEQLDRVRHRYLSTFDLLPPGEYERGLRFLETEMPRRHGDRFEISARFTFVGATR